MLYRKLKVSLLDLSIIYKVPVTEEVLYSRLCLPTSLHPNATASVNSSPLYGSRNDGYMCPPPHFMVPSSNPYFTTGISSDVGVVDKNQEGTGIQSSRKCEMLKILVRSADREWIEGGRHGSPERLVCYLFSYRYFL